MSGGVISMTSIVRGFGHRYLMRNIHCWRHRENRDTWSGLCILECLEWHLVDGKCENCGYDWGSNVHGVRNMPGIRT